jgi:hypothetical protein
MQVPQRCPRVKRDGTAGLVGCPVKRPPKAAPLSRRGRPPASIALDRDPGSPCARRCALRVWGWRCVEVGHRLGPGVLAHPGAGLAGVLVAMLEMDPAVLARQPGLLGRIPEIRPLEGDRLGRHPRMGGRLGCDPGAPSGDGDRHLEVPAAGEPGQHLSRRPEKVEWPEAYSPNGGAGSLGGRYGIQSSPLM